MGMLCSRRGTPAGKGQLNGFYSTNSWPDVTLSGAMIRVHASDAKQPQERGHVSALRGGESTTHIVRKNDKYIIN